MQMHVQISQEGLHLFYELACQLVKAPIVAAIDLSILYYLAYQAHDKQRGTSENDSIIHVARVKDTRCYYETHLSLSNALICLSF